jgi:hypothetical protein
MAKMQTFVINPDRSMSAVAKLTGQAARVYAELIANPVPRTGPEVNAAIESSATPFKTRQDSLRVTLYYLVVFKGQGIVTATRPTATPVEENAFAGDFTADGELVAAE